MSDKFAVQVTRAAEKDLDGLEPYRKRVVSELRALERDPHKGHTLHGKLREYRALEFSLPGGVCRAVYKVKNEQKVCLLVAVGYHEGIYEISALRIRGFKQKTP